ncbi:hypothetical protein B0H14DRAFT_3878503 [Mycena olivaceomarginata]|nr:hypothetical protein B0H14DRAFT_3878503 [Mycena olivaceomarginata]
MWFAPSVHTPSTARGLAWEALSSRATITHSERDRAEHQRAPWNTSLGMLCAAGVCAELTARVIDPYGLSSWVQLVCHSPHFAAHAFRAVAYVASTRLRTGFAPSTHASSTGGRPRCTRLALAHALHNAAQLALASIAPNSVATRRPRLDLPEGQEILHVQDLCTKHSFFLPPRPLTWCVSIDAVPNCRWPRSRDASTAHRRPLTRLRRLGDAAPQHAASSSRRTPGIERERIPLEGDGIWRGLWVQRWQDETAMLFSSGPERRFGAPRCLRAITSSDCKAVFLGLGAPLLSAPRLRSAFAKEWGTIPSLGVLEDTSRYAGCPMLGIAPAWERLGDCALYCTLLYIAPPLGGIPPDIEGISRRVARAGIGITASAGQTPERRVNLKLCGTSLGVLTAHFQSGHNGRRATSHWAFIRRVAAVPPNDLSYPAFQPLMEGWNRSPGNTSEGVWESSFVQGLRSVMSLQEIRMQNLSSGFRPGSTTWAARPTYCTGVCFQLLLGVRRWDDAVDLGVAFQRGLREAEGWIRMIEGRKDDALLTVADLRETTMPVANDDLIGLWVNGMPEAGVLLLMKQKVPCFIVHEFPPETPVLCSAVPRPPTFFSFVEGTDVVYTTRISSSQRTRDA